MVQLVYNVCVHWGYGEGGREIGVREANAC